MMIGKIDIRGQLHGANQIYFESNSFNVFNVKNGEKLGREFKKIWLFHDYDKDTGDAIMIEKFEVLKWIKLTKKSNSKSVWKRQIANKVHIYDLNCNQYSRAQNFGPGNYYMN